MIRKFIPIATQAALVPITIYFCFFVIVPNEEIAVKLLLAFITIVAVLAGLSFAASGTDTDSQNYKFGEAAKYFFETTVLASVAVALVYAQIELSTKLSDMLWLFGVRVLVALVSGLVFGLAAVSLHLGLWIIQKRFGENR